MLCDVKSVGIRMVWDGCVKGPDGTAFGVVCFNRWGWRAEIHLDPAEGLVGLLGPQKKVVILDPEQPALGLSAILAQSRLSHRLSTEMGIYKHDTSHTIGI